MRPSYFLRLLREDPKSGTPVLHCNTPVEQMTKVPSVDLLFGFAQESAKRLKVPQFGVHIPGAPNNIAQSRFYSSTRQLPCKRPQIPSNRYHKALRRATLGVYVGIL